jgi:hypothetical protein
VRSPRAALEAMLYSRSFGRGTLIPVLGDNQWRVGSHDHRNWISAREEKRARLLQKLKEKKAGSK